MATVKIDYFGFAGQGPTVKEAKQDAGRKIQALQQGYWTPKIVAWRGYAILVTRNLQGWDQYFIQHPDEPTPRVGSCCCGFDSERESVHSAEMHLADLGWSPDTDALDVFPEFPTLTDYDRRDLISRRKWCLQIQHLTAAGLDTERARAIADGREPAPDGITLRTF